MPNHIHVLIGFKKTGKNINRTVGDGKRFIAYQLVKRLKEQNDVPVLEQLKNTVEGKDRERNKLHEVWSHSFDWKECRSDAFMAQKLEYMHNNPCSGKWNGANFTSAYLHSSAAFYAGDKSFYAGPHFNELDDVNLASRD